MGLFSSNFIIETKFSKIEIIKKLQAETSNFSDFGKMEFSFEGKIDTNSVEFSLLPTSKIIEWHSGSQLRPIIKIRLENDLNCNIECKIQLKNGLRFFLYFIMVIGSLSIPLFFILFHQFPENEFLKTSRILLPIAYVLFFTIFWFNFEEKKGDVVNALFKMFD